MKVGDIVEVISGEWKGGVGRVTSILNGNIVTVQPNVYADSKPFYKKELKVVDGARKVAKRSFVK